MNKQKKKTLNGHSHDKKSHHQRMKTNNDSLLDNSPITIARLTQPHKHRMVTSIALTSNYQDDLMIIPTTGLFLVSSGADHRVVCLAPTDVIRESLRKKYHGQ